MEKSDSIMIIFLSLDHVDKAFEEALLQEHLL